MNRIATGRKPTRTEDPVGLWLQRQNISTSRLKYEVPLAMPGGVLSLRTNHSGFSAYVRDRCRHLLNVGSAVPDVVANVMCLSGKIWPAVRPFGRNGEMTKDSILNFQCFCENGTTCVWQQPTLMGVLRTSAPQIRIVATELNPRWLPLPIKRLLVKNNDDSLDLPKVLDLLFCLFARSRGFTILHAAVLEQNGRGVLLLGESGCGKTTAALALARAGFRLVTDEYAVLWNRGKYRGRCGGILVPPMIVGRVVTPLEQLEQTLGHERTSRKVALPVFGIQVRSNPVKLAAMILLARPETRAVDHQATHLAPDAAFGVLMSQLRDPISSGRSEFCETMLELVNGIHAYRMTAGTKLKTLPTIVERLMSGHLPGQGFTS